MLMVAIFATNVNAQTAIEEQKILDNIYVGITGGVSTPLSFDSMFPVNPEFGVKLGKEFTPVFGAELEGITFLGSNSTNGHFDIHHCAFRATNVGINGTINWSNLLYGFNDRIFNVKTSTGFGWLHTFNANSKDFNNLSAKTGVQALFNLGKGHSLFAEPSIIWNLNKLSNVKFNKNNSQLLFNIGYIYNFKTSNGTHTFKKYDVGAMMEEINNLRNQQPTIITKTNTKEVVVNNYVKDEYIVYFAQNSDYITDFTTLDEIPNTSKVIVEGYASPEGTSEYNVELSEKRAYNVASYLANRGIEILSCRGFGAIGDNSNRIVIVKVQ